MKRRTLLILALATIIQPLVTIGTPRHGTEEGSPFRPILNLKMADTLPQPQLSEVSEAAYVPPPKPVVVDTNTAPSGCGDNSYANFIYMHESGCRTNAVNPIGACGIGQALPCSKMGCSLSDYACQNAFFTNYANAVYGGWLGAYNHWLAYSWW